MHVHVYAESAHGFTKAYQECHKLFKTRRCAKSKESLWLALQILVSM